MNEYDELQGWTGCVLRPIVTWPGRKTPSRKDSRFKAEWGSTCSILGSELNHIGAKSRVIQIALNEEDFRNDGLPRAAAIRRGHQHPGVVVSYSNRHGSFSIPCDTYFDWQDNIRAIALSLEALRAVDRYGVSRNAEQYTGWKALPSATAPNPSGFANINDAARFIRQAVPFCDKITPQNLDALYRQAARKLHPDAGGTHEAFLQLQEAKRMIENHFKGQR